MVNLKGHPLNEAPEPEIFINRISNDEVKVVIKGALGKEITDRFETEVVMPVLKPSYKKIFLDLSEVSFLNSAVLGKIVAFHWRAQKQNSKLSIRFNPEAQRMILSCKLDKLLNLILPEEENDSK